MTKTDDPKDHKPLYRLWFAWQLIRLVNRVLRDLGMCVYFKNVERDSDQ